MAIAKLVSVRELRDFRVLQELPELQEHRHPPTSAEGAMTKIPMHLILPHFPDFVVLSMLQLKPSLAIDGSPGKEASVKERELPFAIATAAIFSAHRFRDCGRCYRHDCYAEALSS